MLKNFFKTAWRNLWRNRFYTGINIIGLSIGLAVGIIILMWVNDELSYDRYHSKAGEIYRVNAHIGTGKGSEVWTGSIAPIAVFGKNNIPAIKNAARVVHNDYYLQYTYKEKQFVNARSAFIDSSFFSIFDIPLKQGDATNIFPELNSVLITEATAKRFFGNEDPIGKVITADNRDNYTVRGVMQNFPDNSSFQFDMLFPISLVEYEYKNSTGKSIEDDWGNYYFETWLQLQPGASLTAIEKKLTQLLHDHNRDEKNNFFILQPLGNIHLYGADGNSSARQMVQIFFIVAVILLAIACVNYVNLSTARALLRAKEVSVRKIIGADRTNLFFQFVFETVLLFVLATLLAICMVALLMPLYNNVSGKQSHFSLDDPSLWKIIGITATATLAASSIYPALLLSSFKPLQAIKGNLLPRIGNSLFRKVLVVSQFTCSVILIIGTFIIGKQLNYIRDKDLGYDKSYVFAFPMREIGKHYQAVKEELQKQPAVKAVASGGGTVVNLQNATTDTDWDGKEKKRSFLIHPMGIDVGFIPLMKMQMTAGGNFMGSKADSAHYILNETAIKEAGITNPIGSRFSLWGKTGTIIGVVKDFHFVSLKQKIEPAVFYYQPGAFNKRRKP
jgi:putative ABC transport system permease protein